jgi:hypothetical protein
LENIKFGKLELASSNDHGVSRNIMLADVDATVADEILKKLDDLHIGGLNIKRCESLSNLSISNSMELSRRSRNDEGRYPSSRSDNHNGKQWQPRRAFGRQ